MIKTEVKAINDCIRHWKRMQEWAEKQLPDNVITKEIMKERLGETYSNQDCDLCKEYDNDGSFLCTKCPLSQKYGRCGIDTSNAYKVILEAVTCGEWRAASKLMLDQLISLLPEKELTEQEAIQKSIKHWERMQNWVGDCMFFEDPISAKFLKNKLGETYGEIDCALCQEYISDTCKGCPLGKKYGNCKDLGATNAYYKVICANTCQEWWEASKLMVGQLKSLIEKKVEKIEPVDATPVVKSIEHWERMIAWALTQPLYTVPSSAAMLTAIDETWSGMWCPLCNAYGICIGCPLHSKYGFCGPQEDRVLKHFTGRIPLVNAFSSVCYSQTWGEWINYACMMLDQLKALKE